MLTTQHCVYHTMFCGKHNISKTQSKRKVAFTTQNCVYHTIFCGKHNISKTQSKRKVVFTTQYCVYHTILCGEHNLSKTQSMRKVVFTTQYCVVNTTSQILKSMRKVVFTTQNCVFHTILCGQHNISKTQSMRKVVFSTQYGSTKLVFTTQHLCFPHNWVLRNISNRHTDDSRTSTPHMFIFQARHSTHTLHPLVITILQHCMTSQRSGKAKVSCPTTMSSCA